MTLSTYHADDFSIDITVTEDGSAKDITGATIEALIGRGTQVISAAGTLVDAANGVLRVTLSEETLSVGVWRLQVRVTIGTETQTVYEDTLSVRQSLSAA